MTDLKLTAAQLRALKWLSRRGGTGAIDKTGRIVAEGEAAPFDGSTWLRLITFGMVCGPRPNRLMVTGVGDDYLAALDDG